MYRTVRLVAGSIACAVVFSVSGCSQLGLGDGSDGSNAPTLTVGAPPIAEGPLLAELYGQVLESHSYDVFYNFGLDSRAATFTALQNGMVDLLPDFSGDVLHHLYPEARHRSSFEVVSAARKELTAVGLTMLAAGAAESGLAFVATREFTLKNNIDSIGQIIPIESTVTIGAEPGFELGDSGRATLKRIYAVKNWKFLAIKNGDPHKSVDALQTGAAQIVLLEASSPLIKKNNLVIIADPNNVLPADNLIPILASESYPAEVEALVDSVSQALTTEQLQFLTTKRLADDAPSNRQIARDWLAQNRLLGSGTGRS